MPVTRAQINPSILAWARLQVNYDPETLAVRAGVQLSTYQAWESGEKQPTVKQLQKLAHALKRSAGIFYLEHPPEEDQLRLAMRRAWGVPPDADSHHFALEVQTCAQRREYAIELFERLEEYPEIRIERFTLADDVEYVSEYLRNLLGIDIEKQITWKHGYEALRFWRRQIEATNTLVFQLSGVNLVEARGFALWKDTLPIIAINAKDSYTGRIFTLIHELAHLLLRSSVLHNSHPLVTDGVEEQWCNQVAASVLMPKDDFLSIASDHPSGVWLRQEVINIAARYCVSPAAAIRRLRDLGLITYDNYEILREHFDSYAGFNTESSGGSFYSNVLSRLGYYIPTLAFRAYYDARLSVRELASVIGVKVNHLREFEERVMGEAYAFQ